MSSGIVSIQSVTPSFLPRGWHRSPIGRWLLVDDGERALALVARLTEGQSWSWRTALALHGNIWRTPTAPEPFDLTLERACNAVHEWRGRLSDTRPSFELNIRHLWITETHAPALEHRSL